MEAEYIALYHAANHSAWVNGFMSEIGSPLEEPLEIHADNEASIKVASTDEMPFKRAKHIDIKYHKTRNRVLDNEIKIVQVSSDDNLADMFTKVLPLDRFDDQSDSLGFEAVKKLW
jgi:hypothetical protein